LHECIDITQPHPKLIISITLTVKSEHTSSFFSSTDLTSLEPTFELDLFSANFPEGIRLEAVNGELKFGEETAEGSPLVIPAGKPFRGVGLGTGGGGMDVLGEGGGGIEVLGEGGGGIEVLGEGGGGIDVSTESALAPER
jgi:hypothetical protein